MRTEQEIIAKIRQVLINSTDLSVEQYVVSTTRFIEDLNFDSLDCIDFIMEVEDELGIEIDDLDMDKIKTFGDAVAYAIKKGA